MEIREIRGNKKDYMDLLLLADPYEPMLNKYLGTGEMFVLFEGDTAVSECVMFPREDGTIELKNLATQPEYQRRGYARALISDMFARYAGKYPAMYVGTAGDAPFYRALGFEHAYTVKGFFTDNYPEPIVDDGFLCVDMEYYRIDL